MQKRTRGSRLTIGIRILMGFALISLWSATWALAQNYPTRPVKFILHVPPGGSIDAMARMLAESLNKKMGPASRGRKSARGERNDCMNGVVQAPPDGYTLLFGTGATLVINRDHVSSHCHTGAVSRLATNPLMLVVNAKQVSAKTLPEFLEYAKANPGQLNYRPLGTMECQICRL